MRIVLIVVAILMIAIVGYTNDNEWKDILSEVKAGKTWQIEQRSRAEFKFEQTNEKLVCTAGNGALLYKGIVNFENDPYTEFYVRYKGRMHCGILNDGTSGTGPPSDTVKIWCYIFSNNKVASKVDQGPWSMRDKLISNARFQFYLPMEKDAEVYEIRCRSLKEAPESYLHKNKLDEMIRLCTNEEDKALAKYLDLIEKAASKNDWPTVIKYSDEVDKIHGRSQTKENIYKFSDKAIDEFDKECDEVCDLIKDKKFNGAIKFIENLKTKYGKFSLKTTIDYIGIINKSAEMINKGSKKDAKMSLSKINHDILTEKFNKLIEELMKE